ncbi:uncharacterized protein H6S33_011360 [Morchella sextelata]|uniref:uncharacterized protein n=1 Tax=Morchella sextelata TaxID=1174677 RepID=UPI001D05A189|nr:uncharacterized protein H6S33_011360 [Morchella sextelata]KAH0610933.1 hypothetical protein H6S33_011360 [Morchella sextelata]
MPAPENIRSKFTGNVCFYTFIARYRQGVVLWRNIETVIRENEVAQVRGDSSTAKLVLPGNSTPPTTDADARACKRFAARPKVRIDDIMKKLRPSVPTGKDEPQLKIELRTLKRKVPSKRGSRPRSNGTDSSSTEQTPPPPLLYKSSELCTITYDSDESAALEMDDHFYIKASQLYVQPSRGPIKPWGLAESYSAQITLNAIDVDEKWPPFLSGERPQGSKKWREPFYVVLYCTLASLPMTSGISQYDVFLKFDSTSNERSGLSLEVDYGWSQVQSQRNGLDHQLARLPTPTLDKEQFSCSRPTYNVLTIYYFRGSVDDKDLQSQYGAPNPRDQHLFSITGYTCPICDGKKFHNLKFLHLHLITFHDLFHFQVKSREQTKGLDSIIEISVDLSKEQLTARASDHVPDHRVFRWQKPTTRFDLDAMLKGDWAWLNEKKSASLIGNYRREPLQSSNGISAPVRKINLYDVQPLPKMKRRKYVVPEARNGVKGLVFVRNKSKRFVHPGEELSESDDDVDEEWLKMKHGETVEDFSDVVANERKFMVLWDRYLYEERPKGNIQVPPVLVRFARDMGEVLRSSNLLVEFWKHCLNLVQYRVIDAECLKVCMAIAKGNNPWSSAGISTVGLGLAGPIALESSQGVVPPSEDPMDLDGETHDGKPFLKETDHKVEARDSGFCTCGKPYERSQMVLCVGSTCDRRWFHKSCFNLVNLLDEWKCPKCIEVSDNNE